MKSRQESADRHNSDTLGLPIPFSFSLFFQSNPLNTSSLRHCLRRLEWVTSATPHAAGTNRGITVFSIAFWVGASGMGLMGENREEGCKEVQEVSKPIWARRQTPSDSYSHLGPNRSGRNAAGCLGPSAHR